MRKLILVLLALPTAANAALIELEATTDEPFTSGFTVLFDDTGDGLLQWDEIVSFSGATILGDFRDLLSGVPDSPVSTFSVDPNLFTSLGTTLWQFQNTGNPSFVVGKSYLSFDYTLTPVAVPGPGTLALLGIGVAAMGAGRRRRTQ